MKNLKCKLFGHDMEEYPFYEIEPMRYVERCVRCNAEYLDLSWYV